MCLKSSGVCLPLSLVCWSGWRSVRNLICLICLVSVLSIPVWSETSPLSEPDWPELTTYLNEIASGLNMTESASDEIETSQQQREQLLIETEQSLDGRENSLSQREMLLDEREQGLNEQEQDLQQRESLYSGIQTDLDAANTEIRRQKIRSVVWLILAAVAAGVTGYGIGRLTD